MSDNDELPSAALVWTTLGVVTAFAVGAGVLFAVTDPRLHLAPEGFAVFAPVFLAAQAVERFLEPIAARYNTADAEKADLKGAREQKLRVDGAVRVAVAGDPTGVTRSEAAVPAALEDKLIAASEGEQTALRALRKKRSERRLIWFMVASVVSLLLAGVLGLGILEAMSSKPLAEYLGAIDVALTGLVIGAGTKPLHDLIVRLEKGKENADASTKPTEKLATVPAAGSTSPSATSPPA